MTVLNHNLTCSKCSFFPRLEGTRGNVPSIAESVSSSGSQLQSDLEQERLRTAALERKLAQLERPSVVLTC
jgi:hypothetical protein